MRDVALRAGVDTSTVSRALDPDRRHLVKEETVQRVIRASAELGYVLDEVAKNLRQGNTGSVGVIIPDFGNPFSAPVIRGISRILDERNALALVAETEEDSKRLDHLVDHFTRRRADALIVAAATLDDGPRLHRAAQVMPVVLVGRWVSHSDLPVVRYDDVQGGRLVARHFAELGHRTVAQIVGPTRVSPFFDRADGFRAECLHAGMHEIQSAPASAATFAEGLRLMTALIADAQTVPTAVFAHNDLLALGALEALRLNGRRCPEDVSLVGYNDSAEALHLSPPLTTVRQDGEAEGRAAAVLAFHSIAGEKLESPPLMTPFLVVRNSTARPALADRRPITAAGSARPQSTSPTEEFID